MKQILELTTTYKQERLVVLESGLVFTLGLEYVVNQMGWFYYILFGKFATHGNRLVTSSNILRQYKNILPFGVAVMTIDGTDPFLIDDFVTGRVRVFTLNSDDVNFIEATLYNGNA